MFIGVLPEGMSMYHVHAWYPWRPKERFRSHGPGVTNSCESPCGCRDKNPGPL